LNVEIARYAYTKHETGYVSGFESKKQTIFGHRDAINRVSMGSMPGIGRKLAFLIEMGAT
jgi:hypothetical protein